MIFDVEGEKIACLDQEGAWKINTWIIPSLSKFKLGTLETNLSEAIRSGSSS